MNRTRLPALFSVLALVLLLAGCQTDPAGSTAATPAAAAGNPLRVGITPTLAPMVFKQGGKLVGFEVDAARMLGERLGRPVRFVEVKWENQLKALTSGQTDIIMSSMTITAERRMLVTFSNPYLNAGQMMLVRRQDLGAFVLGMPRPLPGPVGVLRGTVGEFLIQRESSASELKTYSNVEDAVKDLADGKLASVVSDAPVIWYQAALNESKGLAVMPRMLTQESLGWAVRAGDPELLGKVNEFLAAAQADGRMSQTLRKWLPQAQ